MCGPAHLADFADASAHKHACIGDQHDLVISVHKRSGNNLAIALTLLNGNHAFGTTPVTCVFSNGCAFTVTVLGGSQHTLLLVFSHQHGNHALAHIKRHTAHTPGITTQGSDIVFVKANSFPAITKQHHIVLAIR